MANIYLSTSPSSPAELLHDEILYIIGLLAALFIVYIYNGVAANRNNLVPQTRSHPYTQGGGHLASARHATASAETNTASAPTTKTTGTMTEGLTHMTIKALGRLQDNQTTNLGLRRAHQLAPEIVDITTYTTTNSDSLSSDEQ